MMKKPYTEPEFEALRFAFSSVMSDLTQHSYTETNASGGYTDGERDGDDIDLD